MKYIDADKFIKKFEKMIDDIPASVDSGAGYVIDEVYKIFDSLQQEQPQVADASKMEQPEIDFEQVLYNHFGQVKDFTLGMRIAAYFYELGLNVRKEEKK